MFEPYKIKSVEKIHITTQAQRDAAIKTAHHNLFKLESKDVMLDFLTDSGTSAMSDKQWAAMQSADESYAGSVSFSKFKNAIADLMPFKHIYPTHQGRAAERLLFSAINTSKNNTIIPNNTHFDTTRGNIESLGGVAVDFATQQDKNFKGNIDIKKLAQLLESDHKKIPLVMLTITNNAGGGQPVSIQNIKETKELCLKYKKPLFMDSCRFAENAYFIQQKEPGYKDKSIKDIVREMFSYADGMTMSAKKDAFANIGGWIALNDSALAEKIETLLILSEGFVTYGGLAGRDLAAIAQGLEEIVEQDYLTHRIEFVNYFASGLKAHNIPIIEPAGGHAVFVDGAKLLKHIPPLQYPAHALAVQLYKDYGIRAVEIGSLMFGKQPDGTEKPASRELLRMAIPRRVYTQSHIDYVINAFAEIQKYKEKIPGYKITWQGEHLRHFTAKLKPIEG